MWETRAQRFAGQCDLQAKQLVLQCSIDQRQAQGKNLGIGALLDHAGGAYALVA